MGLDKGDRAVPDTQPQNGIVPQTDAFMHATPPRPKSAPGTLESGSESISSESSSISTESLNKEKRKKESPPKPACLSWGKLQPFFFGHAEEFTNWTTSFEQSSRVKFISLFLVETTLRSIGDITFCSNPFTGLLIWIAILISWPAAGCLGFVTFASGFATAVFYLRVPMDEVRSGGVLFNNFLTGIIATCFMPRDVILTSPQIIPICMGMGILTIIMWRGLNGTLAARLEFPLLIVPFHIMILIYMYSGLGAKFKVDDPSKAIANNGTLHHYENIADSILKGKEAEPLNWLKMLEGVALSPSHVFATMDMETSLLVYASMMVFSPTVMIQSVTGAATASLVGAYLCNPGEYEGLYDGSWCYNSQFTAAALGGLFFILNIRSWLLSIVGSILAALFYGAMVKCNAPPLGIPFMLATWLLLLSRPYDPEPAPEPSIDEETLASGDSESTVKLLPPRRQGPFYRLRLGAISTPEHNRTLLPSGNAIPSSGKYSQARKPPTPMQNAILPL